MFARVFNISVHLFPIFNKSALAQDICTVLYILDLSCIPLLLSVWTIDLAFLLVFPPFVAFLFICSCVFCLFVHVGVRELTLLFSHLQRQRNTKKVLHNSYHTLLSGLRPYSSPYLSGDRYATASQYIQTG